MNLITKTEELVKEILEQNGYGIQNVVLENTSRPDLGQFQINVAMSIAKKIHCNPLNVATKIKNELNKSELFYNVNIAGAGFVNISFSNNTLIGFANEYLKDLKQAFTTDYKKKIFIDYGGANIAKALHVGHLRSADIGEALKRLTQMLGIEVVSDVHFGDIGRQSGIIISEIKRNFPDLVFFDLNFKGKYPTNIPITAKDLDVLYPIASKDAKESEERMEEVRQITSDLESGNKGYIALWNIIKKLSIKNIKKIYARINTSFDLWEGESDCYPYIPTILEHFKKNNFMYESEGAYVIDVAEEDDELKIPPLIVIKTNGSTVYGTRELATLYSRIKRFKPDEIWYVVDNRQEMYFKQVFRAAYKTGLVPKTTELKFAGFGTMNGNDGKPFKTRDGGVMQLTDLLDSVKQISLEKLNPSITNTKQREEISKKIAVSAVKFADLLPNRSTDYIFDIDKFVSLEGKTGPYLLYSVIRIKSLLNKAIAKGLSIGKIEILTGATDKDILSKLVTLNKMLNKAFYTQSVNDIAEYLYNLITTYNKFYSENNILNEQNIKLRDSWLALSQLIYNISKSLIEILGMEIPEKM
ncbi:MAG: arginine--tRNA ligase [Clostridia bacterium]|jgi:arginyl-tRNA synthetase|nr:arginine--tRNA ligase [Clostridia bacterium]MDD4275770.1 arginine--tRNA ligase [Clostridia bacterium]